MKKIATITFHGAHNYGSNLQSYALQEYIKKIAGSGCIYEILNLRTDIQKRQYSLNKDNKITSKIVRKFLLKDFDRKNKGKYEKFENFINNKLQVTKEYSSLEELKNANLKYDYLISRKRPIMEFKGKWFWLVIFFRICK